MSENIALDFHFTTVYGQIQLNAVGATTSLTLRTAPAAPGAGGAYVRKFGTPYLIQDVIAGTTIAPRGAGAGSVGRFRIYSATTNTLLATVTDTVGGALVFADGAALAAPEAVYIILDNTGAGTYTCGAALVMTLCTNLDPAGLAVQCSVEAVIPGAANAITWYVAIGGSTYYDGGYIYGGRRHVPVLASARYPYFSITAAITGIGAVANQIVEILDDEAHMATGSFADALTQPVTIQSSLGRTPTITRNIGANCCRAPMSTYSNTNAKYWNENGNDANPGTWQLPFLTPAACWAGGAAGGLACVYGGVGATPSGGTFPVNLTLNRGNNLDADFMYAPTFRASVSNAVTVTAATTGIGGFIFLGPGNNGVYGNGQAPTVSNCTFTGWYRAIETTVNAVVARCKIQNCSNGIQFTNASAAAVNIANNDILDGDYGLIIAGNLTNAGNSITGNLFARMTQMGVELTGDVVGTVENLTFYQCAYAGLDVGIFGAVTAPFDDCIFDSCLTGVQTSGVLDVIVTNWCVGYNNGADSGGPGVETMNNFTNGAPGPMFANVATNRFGITPTSTAYRYTPGVNDAGISHLRVLFSVRANSCTFDGLIFDGRESACSAIQHYQSTRTGTTIKWCTFEHFTGIAVDLYGTAALSALCRNLLFDSNGTGLSQSGGTVTQYQCAILNTDRVGIYCYGTLHDMVHISVSVADYGIYTETGSIPATIRNCIISGCRLDPIYAPGYCYVTYCCVYGTISIPGLIYDPSNIKVNPYFLDPVSDLRLYRIANGSPLDSPCLGLGDDGYDLGCYLETYGITDESWDTYRVGLDGYSIDDAIVAKGKTGFSAVSGTSSIGAQTHKRTFTIKWPTGLAMTEDVRHWIEYLSTLIEDDYIGTLPEQSIFRLHLKPATFLLGPISGVVDFSAMTVLSAGSAWVPNQWRGYDCTIRYNHQINGILDGGTNTIMSAGAGWTVDEWVGYFVRQAVVDCAGNPIYYNVFSILANTATVLSLSDPFGRIVSVGANFVFDIEADNKISTNTNAYLCLEGPARTNGTYDFCIDTIRCRLRDTGVDIRGTGGWNSDTAYMMSRVPDRIQFEEI